MIIGVVDICSHELDFEQLRSLVRLHTDLKFIALPLAKQDGLPYHMQVLIFDERA